MTQFTPGETICTSCGQFIKADEEFNHAAGCFTHTVCPTKQPQSDMPVSNHEHSFMPDGRCRYASCMVIEPPEDLRAALTDIIVGILQLPRGKTVVPGDYADEILRLCEAAALAALPEKQIPEAERLTAIDNKYQVDASVLPLIQNSGHNQAIATAQANIHSVFGGTS